jgi:hypothetical protein
MLYFERSPNQQAITSLHVLITGAVAFGQLYGAVHGLMARLRKATGLPGNNTELS